jgi:hypothetical protein
MTASYLEELDNAILSGSAFHTQGDPRGVGEVAAIGVGMLGYAFMGKAHSNALKKIAYMTWPPPLVP